MTGPDREPSRTAERGLLAPLLAALALLAACALAACGSSGSPSADSSAAAVKTAITAWMPKDASSEPPWNGRFVQVDVTTAEPDAMRAEDWRIFVNGNEPKLDKPASILPYAPHAATVAFVFRAPYGDAGTYAFRVVYAPKDGAKVERAWEYEW
jgi:maltose-binding protein MalE